MSDHSNSDDDERPLTEGEVFKNDLFYRIVQVHSTGSFATFGIVDSFVHPGISVEPIGTVRLPLSNEDANTLIQASHKAPFGKGTETVVDESVRKTWEVDAEKIHFLNKGWQSCLDRTVKHVARDLGVAGGDTYVRAEFYKMLLYEKGAMFKAHQEYVIRKFHKASADDQQHREDSRHVWNAHHLSSIQTHRRRCLPATWKKISKIRHQRDFGVRYRFHRLVRAQR